MWPSSKLVTAERDGYVALQKRRFFRGAKDDNYPFSTLLIVSFSTLLL